MIAYFNTAQVSKGLESGRMSLYSLSEDEDEDISAAIDRLTRIKWENIAFIGFQFWFVGMSLDAVKENNHL